MNVKREGWREVRLGEIADFRNGVNYTKDNFGRGVKVINVKDFQDYTSPRYDTLDEINPVGVVRKAHLLRENDVIFVRSRRSPTSAVQSADVPSLLRRVPAPKPHPQVFSRDWQRT